MLRPGSCLELLQTIPDKSVQLVVTCPLWNEQNAFADKVLE